MAHLLVNLPGEKHTVSCYKKNAVQKGLNLHTADKTLASVDQVLDNAIHWINLYPTDNTILVSLIPVLIH